jgi:hypothetical protein
MVFNSTFNNFSVISWRSDLLVEETGVHGEIHRPVASHLTNSWPFNRSLSNIYTNQTGHYAGRKSAPHLLRMSRSWYIKHNTHQFLMCNIMLEVVIGDPTQGQNIRPCPLYHLSYRNLSSAQGSISCPSPFIFRSRAHIMPFPLYLRSRAHIMPFPLYLCSRVHIMPFPLYLPLKGP